MIGYNSYQDKHFDEDYDILGCEEEENEYETCDEDLDPRSRKYRLEND